MLTRKTAIARLRATGTLGPDGQRTNTITKAEANSSLTYSLQKLMSNNKRSGGQRLLAPSSAQMVLP